MKFQSVLDAAIVESHQKGRPWKYVRSGKIFEVEMSEWQEHMFISRLSTLPARDGARQPRQTSFHEFHILAHTFVTVTKKFVRIGHHSCAELIKHCFASLQIKKSLLNSKNCSYNQRIALLCFIIGFCDCRKSELYFFKEGLIHKINAYGPFQNQFASSVSTSPSCTLKIGRENDQIYRQLYPKARGANLQLRASSERARDGAARLGVLYPVLKYNLPAAHERLLHLSYYLCCT